MLCSKMRNVVITKAGQPFIDNMYFRQMLIHPIMVELRLSSSDYFTKPSLIRKKTIHLFDHRSQKRYLRRTKVIETVTHRNDIKPFLHVNKVFNHSPCQLCSSGANQAQDNKVTIPVELIIFINA